MSLLYIYRYRWLLDEPTGGQTCARLSTENGEDGYWKDVQCSNRYSFICKKGRDYMYDIYIVEHHLRNCQIADALSNRPRLETPLSRFYPNLSSFYNRFIMVNNSRADIIPHHPLLFIKALNDTHTKTILKPSFFE